MDLQIINIFDHEDKAEHVTFSVINDTNLKNFIVLDDTFNAEGKLSNKERHPFWFPDWEVQSYDQVRLYTGAGNNKTLLMIRDGKPVHFAGRQLNVHHIFWNLKSSVWNKNGDEAFLIAIEDFEKIRVAKA
jgi:hypothetical protein